MIRQTHTYAELEVSAPVYDEIANLLRTARYDHAFIENAIDMHGIALVKRVSPCCQYTRGDPGCNCKDENLQCVRRRA